MANPPDIDPPGKGSVPTFENRNDVPMIYFDIAPAYGVMSGIVQVELGARILVPTRTTASMSSLFPAEGCDVARPLLYISGTRSMRR